MEDDIIDRIEKKRLIWNGLLKGMPENRWPIKFWNSTPSERRKRRVQRRAVRLIGDPALTCHIQAHPHRRAVGDQSDSAPPS
nr:unnamed protein product [Callosobruchus chinensis]